MHSFYFGSLLTRRKYAKVYMHKHRQSFKDRKGTN